MTATEQAPVEYSVSDQVALIWLNRPDRLNAVTPELVDELLEALDGAANSGTRAVVLAGRGRAFCAGHDLTQPAPQGDSRARLERLQDVTRTLRALPQPVIAAVHGYAIGAGAEFALGCDLILAADDAVFAFPEAGLGLSVTGAASRLLPLIVGPVRAREMILLGERVTAPVAKGIGLVNRMVPAEDLMEHALSMAGRIAAMPPSSVTMAKRALDRGIDATVEQALEVETGHALLTEGSAEVEQAARKFQQRKFQERE